jgi:hypothetical protein
MSNLETRKIIFGLPSSANEGNVTAYAEDLREHQEAIRPGSAKPNPLSHQKDGGQVPPPHYEVAD